MSPSSRKRVTTTNGPGPDEKKSKEAKRGGEDADANQRSGTGRPPVASSRKWLKLSLLSLAIACFTFAFHDQLSGIFKLAIIRLRPDEGRHQDISSPVQDKAALLFTPPPKRSLPAVRNRSADIAKRDAIKAAFEHSWSAYRRDAWGLDEYHPLSKGGSNLLEKGIGYTIIDSLDTLILMGLTEEYKAARDWVKHELDWNVGGKLNVFETTIRMLGGLLSASSLIKDPPNRAIPASVEDSELFLSKAIELADRLVPAFDTPTGIPLREIDLETGQAYPDVDNNNASSLAEATTIQLEFKYLAHLTQDKTYWRLAEKPMQAVKSAGEKIQVDGIMPIFISPYHGGFFMSDIRLGSRGDSYYEYLIKQWLQTNRTEQVYKDMYDAAMRGIKKNLVRQSTKSKPPLLYTAEIVPQRSFDGKPAWRLLPKQDHLVCFIGGSFMLGSTTSERTPAGVRLASPLESEEEAGEIRVEDWRVGHELIRTCVDTYTGTKTGLAPEIAFFRTPQEGKVAEQEDWFIKKSLPTRFGDEEPVPLIDARNILRPETVESLFIAFQLSGGDEMYREWGWRIFEAFEKHCKVAEGGYASIDNVESDDPRKLDRMETFWLSETLKYLYLLFSDQELVPLSEWVFNTEAHPLPVFEPTFGTTVH
ncbi:hypothetical protein IE53DRAFT_383526 [Violaceomyces palustris]|uniref:Uncharacterized protein n=1 Tax=Violaceomyces palustris TaxID=1673888 RepID=A0ACD0P791_9BASI|nr:hypothetical protein IE53DRAFT_383526 [Violaceomyces palustris]